MKSVLGGAADSCVQTVLLLLYNCAGSAGLRDAVPD